MIWGRGASIDMGVMGGECGAKEGEDCDSRFNREGGNMDG